MVNSRLMSVRPVNVSVNPVNRTSPRRRPAAAPAAGLRAAVLAAAVLAAAGATAPAIAQDGAPGPGFGGVRPAIRDVTPPGILPGPDVDGPLVREAVPIPAADPPHWHRFFLPATTDAATFVTDRQAIRVSGVTPPPADRMCRSGDGSLWPCGRVALNALRMFLRGRAVECYFPWSGDVEQVIAPCRVGSTDIGEWLLKQGWAETSDLATDAYRAAEHVARCTRAGIWRGEPPPDDCV